MLALSSGYDKLPDSPSLPSSPHSWNGTQRKMLNTGSRSLDMLNHNIEFIQTWAIFMVLAGTLRFK